MCSIFRFLRGPLLQYPAPALGPGLLHPARNRTPLPFQPTLAPCPLAPDHLKARCDLFIAKLALAMTHWLPVYDFATRWPKVGLMLYPLLFVAGGLAHYRRARQEADETLVPLLGISKRQSGMLGGALFASFAGLLNVVAIPAMVVEYTQTREVYAHKRYRLVQGAVCDFDPMPAGGHKAENFTVEGVPFSIAGINTTNYGYNQAASEGGVMRAGLQVRIAYFRREGQNIILKLDTLATRSH